MLNELDFTERQDFEDATRGLIASDPALKVAADNGSHVWNRPAYDFIQGEAPASVNPSLWRQASLNNIHGLFEVTNGIYQVRGYDLSNMTIIEGETGWIIVDPLTSRETAGAAIAFAREHLHARPIVAMIFTHSHMDHFGGVLGVLTAQGVVAENIRIIVPQGFMEEATSENVIAGPAMSRRAMFMYGKQLARSERRGTWIPVSASHPHLEPSVCSNPPRLSITHRKRLKLTASSSSSRMHPALKPRPS